MNAEYTELMKNPIFAEGLAMFQQAKFEKEKDDKKDTPRFVVSIWLRKYRDQNGQPLSEPDVSACLNKIADCDTAIEADKNANNRHLQEPAKQEVAVTQQPVSGRDSETKDQVAEQSASGDDKSYEFWKWEPFDEDKLAHRQHKNLCKAHNNTTYVPVLLKERGNQLIRDFYSKQGRLPIGVTKFLEGPETAVWFVGVPGQEELTTIPYPKFPRWVMEGTSIYRNLVKPVCEVNSRYPEFMWIPATALLLNYLYPKMTVEMRSNRSGIFLLLIGTKGQTIKSSSVEDAFNYFQLMGCLTHYSPDVKTAEGRSVVWTAGSTEGFGSEMQSINCKNGVLFYDEFKLLSDKANIESSSMKSHLLSIYEQGKFSNSTKNRKNGFAFDPGSYVGTLIACTTPKNFHDLWSTFAYGAEGMDDRFFFLLEPEKLVELTPQVTIDSVRLAQGAAQTRKLIEKALMSGRLQMTTEAATLLADSIKGLGNRPSQRAEKWARAIAVDLGRDVIDEDAVKRGIALANYELAVKKYLDVRGAHSKTAAAQLKLCQLLQRQPGGRMPLNGKTGLYAKMRGDSYDTKTWYAIYNGLQQAGRIAEFGKGTKDEPKVVVLMRPLTEED